MSDKKDNKDPRKKILSSCVKMFIEKGYKETTMLDIIKDSCVSAGTFQNLFKTKDGVLFELVGFMFSHKFDVASSMLDKSLGPVALYALETSIQIAIVEQNENLREIYLEAYSSPKLLDFIQKKTTPVLKNVFSSYLPSWQENDFYEAEIGTSGLMRGYMARSCDIYFTLERKIKRFVYSSLRVFAVPNEEIDRVNAFLSKLDLRSISLRVMNNLFSQLEMAFDFKFDK